MTSILRTLFLIPLLLIWPSFAEGGSNQYHQAETLTGAFAAHGSVNIKNVNGQVVLKSWEHDTYEVVITKKARYEDDLKRIEVRRDISADQLSIEVQIPKKKSWFSFGQIEGSVDLEVMVPASVDLQRVRPVNGSLELSGFVNRVNASSVNGRIRAVDLAGSADLDTVNGSIDASFATLATDADLSFKSVNGGLKVRPPADLHADLSTSVVNGRISCDFPIKLADRVNQRRLNGRIGNGGASVRASTVNGSISLREI